MKQNIINLFSNLAGSILGLLGTIGFVMNIIEDKYESIKSQKDKKLHSKEIINRSENINELNFGTCPNIEPVPSKKLMRHEDSGNTFMLASQLEAFNAGQIDQTNSFMTEDRRDFPIKLSKVMPYPS
jgi:hypothetical protein